MAKDRNNKRQGKKKCPHCGKSDAHSHTRAAYSECVTTLGQDKIFKINKG